MSELPDDLDEELDDGSLFATDEELLQQRWEALPFQARIAIEAATCRAGNGDPFPHIRVDMLGSASRIAAHYGLGGRMHDLQRHTVLIRSGLQLGVIRDGAGMSKAVGDTLT